MMGLGWECDVIEVECDVIEVECDVIEVGM